MAERRPLVLVNGELQELPSGDTLPGAGSGLQNNLVATAAPAVTDDSNAGYAVGSRWVDVTNDNTYTCVDASVGAAVWVQENGAGGGASAFTGLSDTPANFTGQALKGLRVNAGETALEYTELGGSQVLTNIFIQDVNSETGYRAAVSVIAAATKGNVVRTQFTVDLKTVQFQGNEATSETYEAVVAEISGTTIGTVLGRATATSTGGTDENIDITFSTPIRMVPNQDYVILITQQGGTGTTTLDSSAGDGALTGIISSYALGGYVTDNDIQGGEIFQSFGSSYVGMSLTYDVVYNANGIGSGIISGAVDPTTEGNDGDWYINTTSNTIFGPKASGTWPAGVSLVGPTGADGTNGTNGQGVPVGGTTGQVLAKIDGTDYNTEWVDAPSGGGMDKVVSALTTYTLTDADFNGRRILYLTANSAISLVLNTGLTGAVGPLMVFAKGTGQITVSGTATIESKGGALKSNGQHGGFSIVPDGSDTFTMSGDITT